MRIIIFIASFIFALILWVLWCLMRSAACESRREEARHSADRDNMDRCDKPIGKE